MVTNLHRSVIVGTPQTGLTENQDQAVRDRLVRHKQSLTKDEEDFIIQENQELKSLQLEPDKPELLASLPKLQLTDLNPDTPKLPIDLKRRGTPVILHHDLFTNGIGYIQVGFNSDCVPLEEIPYLPLLGKMLLEMGTRKKSYVDIFQQLGIHTGGIRTSHFSSLSLNDPKDILSYIFFKNWYMFVCSSMKYYFWCKFSNYIFDLINIT